MAVSDGPATHRAFIYSNRDEYCAVVGGFIREGLRAGERANVVATPERLSWIRQELGPDSDGVVFTDATEATPILSHATRATLQYLAEQEAPTRVIAERHLARLRPFELRDYARMEAAANVVFRRFPVRFLCPYDGTTLGADVLDACRYTHPEMMDPGGSRPNPHFVDPGSFIASSTAVVPPPPAARSLAFASTADVPAARRFVSEGVRDAGVDTPTGEDIVLAAVEVLTNAILHGRAPRTLHMYEEAGALVVHVHDRGPGPGDPLSGFSPPAVAVTHGRGLWMARQLCNAVEVATDGSGTHVRLISRLV